MAFDDKAGGERASMMRLLMLLSKYSIALVHAETEQQFLDAVCRLGVETGGYLMTSIGFAEPDGAMAVRAHAGTEAGHLDLIEVGLAGNPTGQGTADTAIRTQPTFADGPFPFGPGDLYAQQPLRRDSVHRHGSVQDGQRCARTRFRRPAFGRGRKAYPRHRTGRRYCSPLGWRRVRGAADGNRQAHRRRIAKSRVNCSERVQAITSEHQA